MRRRGERRRRSGARRRPVALALAFVTGATALANEVAWQRALAALLGSDGPATAVVLATFLGGLAAGYAAFGRLTRAVPDGPRLLRLYGLVEAAIGLWALAFPALFGPLQRIAAATPPGLLGDLALAASLLGPPTFLMGATLPLLTHALARDLTDATRLHARVYGLNAAGGFAGGLAAGLWALPALGIAGTLAATGAANLAAGAAYLAMGAMDPAGAKRPSRDERASRLPRPPVGAVWAAAALLVGFATIAIQTVWVRVGALAFGASDLTFAVVVATFVLCLALGSLAVGAAPRIPRHAAVAGPAAVAVLLALLHPLLPYAPWAAHQVRVWAGFGPGAHLRFELGAAALVLGVGLIPLGLAGASVPLFFHALRRRMDELGDVVGRLYAWNTLGSVLGALVGGHLLLRWLDLHHVHRVAVGCLAAAAALLAWRERPWPRPATAGLAALAAAGLAAQPPWDPAALSTGHLRLRTADDAAPGRFTLLRAGEVVFAADDPVATVVVSDHTTDDGRRSRALYTQGKSDGSLVPDYPTMALAGLVPCLLARACERVFVIGLGTGVTAGELAELGLVRRVTVAEISPAVIEALALFDAGNRRASESPKVEILARDAYRALLASDAPWDVIVSEPSHPWASGVERLYSLEFLGAARARLAPGGVYAQWMHAYEMDDETLALVLRTFAAAFPRVAVWFANGPDLLLLGLGPEAPADDLEALARRAARPDVRAGLARSGLVPVEPGAGARASGGEPGPPDLLPALLAHELIPAGGVARDALPGPVHTLLHPRLAHRAGRAFFHDASARLPRFPSSGDRAAGLAARRGFASDAERRAFVDEICRTRPFECAARIAAWRHDRPGSDLPERARTHWAETWPEHLRPDRMAVLAALYDVGMPGLGAADAGRVTDHFRAYYDPLRPFRREALVETWRRCVGPGCEAGLRDARARLGLAPDAPRDTRGASDDGARAASP